MNNADIKKYEMSKWKHCVAEFRPINCFYSETNLCCFNCERNNECTELNWDKQQKIIPCKLNMKIQTINGDIEEFVLFDEMERCEWSV